MRSRSRMGLWSTLTPLLLALAGLAAGDGESCRDLGFSSNLMCSACNELKEFSLEFLEEDCRKCCQKDKVDSVSLKVFASAILEVCK
eukprot:m.4564 g.4564  ORF g.4564 m.4564 type:complete len:87 (+) comp10952_c0_seq1:258-518(+)